MYLLLFSILCEVKSLVEMTSFLLSKVNPDENDAVFLLSERVSQDSVENYLAQQRARGGRNDNPTV